MIVLAAYIAGIATLVAIRLGWYIVELRREIDTHVGLLEEIFDLGNDDF